MNDAFHRQELADAYGMAGTWLEDYESSSDRNREALQMAQLALTMLIRNAEATKQAIAERLEKL